MLRGTIIIILLALAGPAFGQTSWCSGAGCGAISPDAANWRRLWLDDPERKREEAVRRDCHYTSHMRLAGSWCLHITDKKGKLRNPGSTRHFPQYDRSYTGE